MRARSAIRESPSAARGVPDCANAAAFHADTLAAIKADVRSLGSGTAIDVASAKARFGVSRKFAIPLLEYLDRERVTRRIGDRRVVI